MTICSWRRNRVAGRAHADSISHAAPRPCLRHRPQHALSAKRGIGTQVAHQIWKQFRGRWEVRVMASNHSAPHVWVNAISKFTIRSEASQSVPALTIGARCACCMPRLGTSQMLVPLQLGFTIDGCSLRNSRQARERCSSY